MRYCSDSKSHSFKMKARLSSPPPLGLKAILDDYSCNRERRKQIMSEDVQRAAGLGEIQSLSGPLTRRHQFCSFFYSSDAAFIQRRRLSLWEIYRPNNASHSKRLLFAVLSAWIPNNSFQFAKFPTVGRKHCWRWQISCHSQQILIFTNMYGHRKNITLYFK
jgi:hypothetical protein